jgi:hypothetical protein
MMVACPLGRVTSVRRCGCRRRCASRRESRRRRWRGGCGSRTTPRTRGGASGAAVAQALVSKGPGGSQCRRSASQVDRLRAALEAGPTVYGWADQRWTLFRIAALIGRLFHTRYTLRGNLVLVTPHRIQPADAGPPRRRTGLEGHRRGDRELGRRFGDISGGDRGVDLLRG